MTDAARTRRAARGARGPGGVAVAWAAGALFLALLALLATRVAEGRDPALRARAAASPPPPRRVLVRKIYERRVIVHLPASAPPQSSQASQSVSSAGAFAGAPVTRAS